MRVLVGGWSYNGVKDSISRSFGEPAWKLLDWMIYIWTRCIFPHWLVTPINLNSNQLSLKVPRRRGKSIATACPGWNYSKCGCIGPYLVYAVWILDQSGKYQLTGHTAIEIAHLLQNTSNGKIVWYPGRLAGRRNCWTGCLYGLSISQWNLSPGKNLFSQPSASLKGIKSWKDIYFLDNIVSIDNNFGDWPLLSPKL